MTVTSLVFCVALVAQEPTREPAVAVAPSAARAERAALIARRKAARQETARAQASRRAAEERLEARRREEEIRMAPVVANQIELARLRAQEQQDQFTRQALMNLQAIEAQRLAAQQFSLALQYWASQGSLRVTIVPPQP